MPKALWRDTVLADSDDTIVLEGNHYFPETSVRKQHLQPSTARSVCSWKGVAHYYDVVVDGAINEQAAWYYPAPKPAAAAIRGRIAFWKGVKVIP